jgi:hypothetical protein
MHLDIRVACLGVLRRVRAARRKAQARKEACCLRREDFRAYEKRRASFAVEIDSITQASIVKLT